MVDCNGLPQFAMDCSGLPPMFCDQSHGFALFRQSKVDDDGDETLFNIFTLIGADEIRLSVDCNGLSQAAVDCRGLQNSGGCATSKPHSPFREYRRR